MFWLSVGHMGFDLAGSEQLFVAVSVGKSDCFLLELQAIFKSLRPLLTDAGIFIHKLNES